MSDCGINNPTKTFVVNTVPMPTGNGTSWFKTIFEQRAECAYCKCKTLKTLCNPCRDLYEHDILSHIRDTTLHTSAFEKNPVSVRSYTRVRKKI